MQPFDTALVLARVLTSGVIMSIEKSDRELPGLERLLASRTGRSKVVLVNSRTAAVHAALAGQGIGHGQRISQPGLDAALQAFHAWLGITVDPDGSATFDEIRLDPTNCHQLTELVGQTSAATLVLDLTGLGFGPAAAMLTQDAIVWARAERLKIFGAYDLRTMWTQQEADADLVPGVQFNYRLSPLVAACIRMALNRATRPADTPGVAA